MFIPNKLMTRQEMKQAYPARWVIVEITKGEIPNVEKGIVRCVASDDEIDSIEIECRKQGLDYHSFRTTVGYF